MNLLSFPVIEYFMDKRVIMMIIMTGLNIAIKDISYLALSSKATPICVLHIRICRKVPLLRSLFGLTNFITNNTWPLLVSDHP